MAISQISCGQWEQWFKEIGLESDVAQSIARNFYEHKMDEVSLLTIYQEHSTSINNFCQLMNQLFHIEVNKFLVFFFLNHF